MAAKRPVHVLFICMGNICRSPLAEALFKHHARKRGVEEHFFIDSVGTGGWHVGELADPRMRAVAEQHDVSVDSRARQVSRDDFEHFDYLICMDQQNRDNIIAMGAPPEKISLLLEHDPQSPEREVPDPYYGGDEGFEHVYTLVDRACQRLLDKLTAAAGVS